MERFLEPNPKLQENNFYRSVFDKKFIFLHHTCGGTASGAISWWNQDKTSVGTPFIIERDGSIIQTFDPKFWTYALGVRGGTHMERASIHIEIVNYGKLTKKDGKFYFVASATSWKEIPKEEVVIYTNSFRNCRHYHKYTDEQVKALIELILYLNSEFNLQLKQIVPNFWQYRKDFKENLPKGIWSHTTVRLDKSDIHPQKELIEALYAIKWP